MFLPAQLMKYWTMRIPEPMPFGLTSLLAIRLAMVSASLVKSNLGGKVETVFTFCTHRFRPSFFFTMSFTLQAALVRGNGHPCHTGAASVPGIGRGGDTGRM